MPAPLAGLTAAGSGRYLPGSCRKLPGSSRTAAGQLPTELATEASSVLNCKNTFNNKCFLSSVFNWLEPPVQSEAARQLPGRYLPLPAAVRPTKGACIETLHFDCLLTL